jgi:hypothetical protein
MASKSGIVFMSQGRIEFWKSGCRQEIQEIQEFKHLRLQIGLRLSIVAVQTN